MASCSLSKKQLASLYRVFFFGSDHLTQIQVDNDNDYSGHFMKLNVWRLHVAIACDLPRAYLIFLSMGWRGPKIGSSLKTRPKRSSLTGKRKHKEKEATVALGSFLGILLFNGDHLFGLLFEFSNGYYRFKWLLQGRFH